MGDHEKGFRLNLQHDQSADILVLYIRLPELTVTLDPQRYTCIEAGRLYRFESTDSDFARDIAVDDDGLVLTYAGLFNRFREL